MIPLLKKCWSRVRKLRAECAQEEKRSRPSCLGLRWRPNDYPELELKEMTLERQCVYEFIDQLTGLVDQYDVVLSLACGAGSSRGRGLPWCSVLRIKHHFLGQTKKQALAGNCRAAAIAAFISLLIFAH